MPEGQDVSGIDVLNQILSSLNSLTEQERERIIKAVCTYFGIALNEGSNKPAPVEQPTLLSAGRRRITFSEDLAISPKDFLLDKQPHTDVERIACLAFYLTHYRDTPYFKTIDLSTLNTEAAQPKFSNATDSSNNAVKMGYLVPAGKGTRQISAAGEQFVRALPDREAARKLMENIYRRKRNRKSATKSENDQTS